MNTFSLFVCLRGLQIKIAPEDLIHEAKAEICVLFAE